MKTRQTLIFLIVLSALLLQACGANAQAAIATGIAQTQQISELQTEAAGGSQASQQDQAGGAEASNVVAVEVTTARDINMRAGDSTAYGVMTVIPANETVTVTGVDEDGSWYQIEYHGAVGWISAIYTSGDVPADMPIVTPPAQANNGGNGGGNGGGGGGGGGGNDNGGDKIDWSGNWNMSFDSDLVQSVHIVQSGNSISGLFVYGSNTVTFSGTLSPDQQGVIRTWTSSAIGDGWPFEWQFNSGNTDQFVGNGTYGSSSFAWCGSRAGASMPTPCFGP
jgi:SH3-like domain-containing protein